MRGPAGSTDDVTDDVTGGGVVTSGLPAVTVLVGVFRRSTGRPALGVVTQPFGHRTGDG